MTGRDIIGDVFSAFFVAFRAFHGFVLSKFGGSCVQGLMLPRFGKGLIATATGHYL